MREPSGSEWLGPTAEEPEQAHGGDGAPNEQVLHSQSLRPGTGPGRHCLPRYPMHGGQGESLVPPLTDRDASACMRRHQAAALAPVPPYTHDTSLSLCHPTHYEPLFLEFHRWRHITRRAIFARTYLGGGHQFSLALQHVSPLNPRFLTQMVSYDVASNMPGPTLEAATRPS
jgi:hypothetical protein